MQLTAVNAKAIQELYAIITEQKNLAASQQEEIDELKRQIQRLDQPK
jgi:polyhydroxyalkanoate synthesis regulator phasin